MTPIPPALETAAASLGPAATFIPASMMGWLIFKRSVVTVRICSVFEDMFSCVLWAMYEGSLRGDELAAMIAVSVCTAVGVGEESLLR